jgi:quercetin dioxygenase-like cupin family protein
MSTSSDQHDARVSAFADLVSLERLAIWDGVSGRVVGGERAALVIVELEPGSVVPEHSHDNEQIGVCASGTLTFRVGDESRELGPGDTWSIPSGVLHEVRTGPDGAVVIEAFVPARAEWSALERLEPGALRWPA